MRRYLNTLYVTSENAWVRKDGENVVVETEGKEQGRVPIHMLGSIVCFSHAGTSPALLGHCAKNGVSVSFLTPYGRFLARVEGPVSGNVLLRREQYRRADEPTATAGIARHIVVAKIANQRSVLRRALSDHGRRTGTDAPTTLSKAERALADAAAAGPGTATTRKHYVGSREKQREPTSVSSDT